MLEKGDDSILKSISSFSASLPGSNQYFSQTISKSVNFTRHIRITSEGKDMFNLFLTFSLADLHEKELHEKLPKNYTDTYLKNTTISRSTTN